MNNQEVERSFNKIDESLKKFIREKYPNKDYPEHLKDEMSLKNVAIGYLTLKEPFEKGNVPVSTAFDSGFVDKLRALWDEGYILASLGLHDCEFCIPPDTAKSSCEKTLVDKANKIKYILPEMIFHYIEVHQFKPAEEFIKFIMSQGNKYFYNKIVAKLGIPKCILEDDGTHTNRMNK